MRGTRRVLLLDPELGNPGGHYQNYMEALRAACEQSCLGFASAGWRGGRSDYPVFDRMHEAFVPRALGGDLVNPFLGRMRMREQLREGLAGAAGRECLVLAATVNHRHFGALADWMEEQGREAPRLAVLVRFPLFDPRRGRYVMTAGMARRGLQRLAGAAPGCVRVVADSDELAEEYRRAAGIRVDSLPIPHMIPQELLGERPARADGPVRLGYFGEARREKGYDRMLEAAAELASRSEVEFVLQRYVRNGYAGGGEAGNGYTGANVRFLEGVLNPRDYYREFLACDAIVMPYRQERYAARNSGILADALAAGLPVITTRGSWMERQMETSGAGVSGEFSRSGELAAAILRLAENLDSARGHAREKAAAWRREHCAGLFLRRLLAIFEEAR